MTFKQSIEYLYSRLPAYHRIGKAAYKANLDNSCILDEYFSHPHRKYLTIHVAGTNGKGSVSHMIASVLQEAGVRTGLFTSPHLRDFRERIKVNGGMIPKKEVTDFIKKHEAIINSLNPSFFELTAAMAFDWFERAGAEAAVIETGLGGRLDSTNIISPLLSVITNIGHDHMDMLGDSLEKVALEKAGIIKKGVPVVIGENQEEVKNVFISCAADRNSEIFFAGTRFRCMLDKDINIKGERNFTIADLVMNRETSGIVPLGGDYQSANLVTLFQSFDILKDLISLPEASLTAGIARTVANTGLLGRWQIIANMPLTICDTGHNKEGLEYVTRQIGNIPCTGLHIVLGFVSDKDFSSILPLFPPDAKYYFTKARVQRAMDENVLAAMAAPYGLSGSSYPDVKGALKAARKNASGSDVIFIGGSTFVVAEVI